MNVRVDLRRAQQIEIGALAILYLQEKPNAVTRGRLSEHDVVHIEETLVRLHVDYTEAGSQALQGKILSLVRMGQLDDRLSRIARGD